jgi:hypothetical protein
MLAEVIRNRLTAPEFQPFTLVLVNGERIDVHHRDSLVHPSTVANGRRIFSPYVILAQAEGDSVVTRHISLPMIAQVLDEDRLNGAT